MSPFTEQPLFLPDFFCTGGGWSTTDNEEKVPELLWGVDQVNTTPEPEGTSNPTQESTCLPTQEVSSNLSLAPDVGQQEQEEIGTSLEPASKKLRSNVWER
ncbi:unnamed protein product [Vicia faba]|uniref:Uncharacterized protein n=1 Tax=Vicia faba TaxID=3906 RepID=A0AAV0ZEZ5_VICFA|nr:unnamed protein product [Vicia faba]